MLLLTSLAIEPRTIEALPFTALICARPGGAWEPAKPDSGSRGDTAISEPSGTSETAGLVHYTTAGNTVDNMTYIDDEGIDGSPGAIPFVTKCGGDTNNPHAIGVRYDAQVGQWAIFNQDFATMPIDAGFDLRMTVASGSVFVQRATSENIVRHATYIDHPLTNGRPDALLQVTQNWNPGGQGGAYNPHTIGVMYDTQAGQWAIFNQDFAAMPINAAFDVEVTNAGQSALVHRAATANTAGAITYIDHPLINGNPKTILVVTQNRNPGGVGGTYNSHEIGVGYDSKRGRWAIFNQDGKDIPANAAFNIYIARK